MAGKEPVMNHPAVALVAAFVLSAGVASAQTQVPSGRGATTGDPAASSATPGTSPTTGSGMNAGPSGSGTSSSGGSDANSDQGRDKMPGSNRNVRPENEQTIPQRDKR